MWFWGVCYKLNFDFCLLNLEIVIFIKFNICYILNIIINNIYMLCSVSVYRLNVSYVTSTRHFRQPYSCRPDPTRDTTRNTYLIRHVNFRHVQNLFFLVWFSSTSKVLQVLIDGFEEKIEKGVPDVEGDEEDVLACCSKDVMEYSWLIYIKLLLSASNKVHLTLKVKGVLTQCLIVSCAFLFFKRKHSFYSVIITNNNSI